MASRLKKDTMEGRRGDDPPNRGWGVEWSLRGGLCLRPHHNRAERTFAVTPARLGVPYNVSGMLTFLNACSLRIVKEMAFTATPISAERAEGLGIINHMVAVEELEPFTYELARNIAENAPLSAAVMKEQLRMLAGAHPISPRRFERVQGAPGLLRARDQGDILCRLRPAI